MAPSMHDPRVEFESRFGITDLDALPDTYGWPRENADGYRIKEQLCGTERPMRIVHIGCGASAIALAKFLPEMLNNVSFTCYDKNEEIGGTWWENKYPGIACDIPSANYQFTWARNPNWSQFYSSGTEIWQYLKDVVVRYDLDKYMKLNHLITGTYWDDETGLWKVHIEDLISGAKFIDHAEVLINGSGLLNNWKWPDIDGLHSFQGKICHTANYDTSIDLHGKRVAVIGVGSSGIQVTATIAPQVGHLYTWIRSPTWVTAGFAQKFAGPDGGNFAYTAEQKKSFTENPTEYVKYCKTIEDELNQRFKFILAGTPEAEEAKAFSRNEMEERLKGRRDLIDKLIPTTFGVGCRRPTPGPGFLEALTMPHVTTFTQDLQQITPKGFLDHQGVEHEVDVIICATGFDTTWIPRFPIVGKTETNLQDSLKGKPISYLGVAFPDIPNYWTGVGPYGPLGHGSFFPIVEMVYRQFLTIVKKMQTENIKSITPRHEVCDAFAAHADVFLKRTAWSGDCRSWFKQGRRDGPLAMFPGTRLTYFTLMEKPRYEDYRIEYQSGNPFGFLGNGFSTREYNGSDLSWYLGDDPTTRVSFKGVVAL
ncbi:FAD/NAD-P-binding domain-containing protein [Exophiala viscosa]|uniref:FAD/NAD-P-binding domain-containing protein n=1 Tax=Exophiala viscosa TaxID=2486360 RepID=A0AAN6IDW9_9EURO|nr:FAD/NAD-P-binding domain-containing protein [Exophiala viscosa]